MNLFLVVLWMLLIHPRHTFRLYQHCECLNRRSTADACSSKYQLKLLVLGESSDYDGSIVILLRILHVKF